MSPEAASGIIFIELLFFIGMEWQKMQKLKKLMELGTNQV